MNQHVLHYTIVEKLGEGGMGVVYKAEDTRLERPVALKFLSPQVAASEEDKSRFLREARAASAINHPNICTVYSIEEFEGQLFIAMEFVDGRTLRHILLDHSAEKLSLDQAIDIGIQVAEGIAAAHARGIVHRDVKPENIILRKDGIPLLMDFGLAHRPGAVHPTNSEGPVGTTAYMSPEQARGEHLDHRTDIWSFGVVLYEMFCGVTPFPGEYEQAVIYRILNEEPPPPRSHRTDLSAQAEAILRKALAKDRTSRYQTMKELLSDLQGLRNPPAGSAPVISSPPTQYTKSGDVNIAYQIAGAGPVDLVYVMGWVSNIDLFWEEPSCARFLNRLASFSRLILFDKRGTGLSDRVHNSELPTLEQRMDDVRAVMDAAGSRRAIIFGVSEGGPMSALFAATYPERTLGLVMYGSYAKRIWDPEYPWAPTPGERQKFFDAISQGWGGVVDLATLAPSVAKDPGYAGWWASYLRRSASPGAALALAKMNTQIDIRNILPAIRVPTLILHRTGDLDINVGGSRFMAAQIGGSRYVEFPGNDHIPWVGDQDSIHDEIEAFAATLRAPEEIDTILATILMMRSEGSAFAFDNYLSANMALVDRHRGAMIEASPNACTLSFDGPARAIRAARLIRRSLRAAGVGLKCALHTGECQVSGKRLSGLPLEICAEIAQRAGSGDIVATRTVKDLIAGSGIEFSDRGTMTLDRGRGVWDLYSIGDDTDQDSMEEPAPKREKSIVVLPFENIGQEKEAEYFSDGLTDEITTSLSQIRSLKVISRTSAVRYKGTSKALKEIGAELQVQFVLEGSVRKQGEHVRISTNLIDVGRDARLWSERYAASLEDIFQIQEQLASRITAALQLKLSPEEGGSLKKRLTTSKEAYEEYLRGRFHWNKRTEGAVKKGLEHFQRAIDIDPLYSLAYAGLADAYLAAGLMEFMPPHDAFPKAKAAAEKAIELNPQGAEAYAALGLGRFQYEWDWAGAEEAFTKSISLNHNYGTAHHYYADYLKAMGRFEEALCEMRKGHELDPLSLAINTGVGHVLYLSRRYDQALEQYKKTIELDPHFLQARLWFGRPYLQKGMYQEAIRELNVAVELSERSTMSLAMLGHAYAASGDRARAMNILEQLMKRAGSNYVPSYWIGMVYIGLGDKENAFRWLDRALQERSCWLAWINVEPRFDILRSDPRFGSLLGKMGLSA